MEFFKGVRSIKLMFNILIYYSIKTDIFFKCNGFALNVGADYEYPISLSYMSIKIPLHKNIFPYYVCKSGETRYFMLFF